MNPRPGGSSSGFRNQGLSSESAETTEVDPSRGLYEGMVTLVEKLEDDHVQDSEVCQDEQNLTHSAATSQRPRLLSTTVGKAIESGRGKVSCHLILAVCPDDPLLQGDLQSPFRIGCHLARDKFSPVDQLNHAVGCDALGNDRWRDQ